MSRQGFFSIVKKGGEGEFQIRARAKRHLGNLIRAAHLDGQNIVESMSTDYRYRIIVKADQLHRVFEALEKSIDYDNVKGCIASIPGEEKYEAALHRVWSIMADALQPTRPYSGLSTRKNYSDGQPPLEL
jgi:hypothetical protein